MPDLAQTCLLARLWPLNCTVYQKQVYLPNGEGHNPLCHQNTRSCLNFFFPLTHCCRPKQSTPRTCPACWSRLSEKRTWAGLSLCSRVVGSPPPTIQMSEMSRYVCCVCRVHVRVPVCACIFGLCFCVDRLFCSLCCFTFGFL